MNFKQRCYPWKCVVHDVVPDVSGMPFIKVWRELSHACPAFQIYCHVNPIQQWSLGWSRGPWGTHDSATGQGGHLRFHLHHLSHHPGRCSTCRHPGESTSLGFHILSGIIIIIIIIIIITIPTCKFYNEIVEPSEPIIRHKVYPNKRRASQAPKPIFNSSVQVLKMHVLIHWRFKATYWDNIPWHRPNMWELLPI